MDYRLAQSDIGRLIAPIDDPKIAEFVAQLEPINALARPFTWFPVAAAIGIGQRYGHRLLRRSLHHRQHVRLGVDRGASPLRLQIRPRPRLSPPRQVASEAGPALLSSLLAPGGPH